MNYTLNPQETKFVLTPEGPHYGKTVDAASGRFIRWEKKPETIERETENARRIKILQGLPLTEWQKGFVASCAEAKKLSPKMQAKLDEVWKETSR